MRARATALGATALLGMAVAQACAGGGSGGGRTRPAASRSSVAAGEVTADGAVTRRPRATATPDGGRLVRVALSVAAAAPRLAAEGGFRLLAGHEELAVVPGGPEWRVERSDGRLRAVGPQGATPWRAGPLVARPLPGTFLAHGGKRWRGELWLWPAAGGGVTVVDHLGVEDYLRGVVPLELDVSGPRDAPALEAQAVAARSYTFSRLPEFLPRAQAQQRAALPYDLRPTTADQVYGGVEAERPASDRAVRSTAGLVLRWGGTIVSAPYHSACGGSTAAATDLWRGGTAASEPWLRGVSDRVPGTERAYCDLAPRFRWTRDYDAATLETVLARYLRRYAGGSAADGGPLGAVQRLGIEERAPSGRVARLAVRTEAGQFVLRGNDIRFAVRSLGGEILPSTYFSVEAVAGGDGRLARVTLRGHGNGHGVGMCQWGAVGRARAGQGFRAILLAYFPGTSVEPAE